MEIVFFHRKGGPGANSIEISFRPLIEKLKIDCNIKEYHVPYEGGNPINLFKNICFIRKHSSSTGINHITGDIHYGVIGLIGRISVLTIHDDYAVRVARRGFLDKIFKWLFWLWIPTKLASASVCITTATKNKLRRLHINSELEVIAHHVVSPMLSPKYKEFNKMCPRILQFGTAKSKNMYSTIRALKDISCKLIIMKNPLTSEQTSFIESMGIHYENKYNLDFKEVVNEYDNCDIVAFPSLFEGFGLPIIEAQASGKPVITTNDEPMKWVAGNGAMLLNNPLDVSEYKEAFIKIINDDEYRNDLVEKGIENVKRFSVENAIKQYLNLYKKLLNKR